MENTREKRFDAVVDHIAVESKDIQADVREYQQLGFKLETLYDDWAMLRDNRGFGVALLAPDSKHPPHLGMRVDTRAELEVAAEREGRPIKEHRDRSISFYTKGINGFIVELIHFPPEYTGHKEEPNQQ